MSGTARVRCAIYTRKSTDEGLDQSFNTLDAQREACEAYVRSQAGEGWRTLPQSYDDGGYSGGNLNRPAMQRLLADVDAGKVDVIVVYKVDRLTRSLLDFAKIVERLDARGVSFVSVTQAFNTTTSMGRLTLNVLLSFAQFEREVTGERIRDKIAASKAKGMWMGGAVPLGYDLKDRRLLVNTIEAEQVRRIFERYVELKSGVALMKELKRHGILSKRWISRAGKQRGGLPFSCGALYYLLQNRIYVGEIVHRAICHKGDHEPIVDAQLFDAAQATLAANRRSRGERPARSAACALAGLVWRSNGGVLSTSFSYGRRGRLYRYYVSGSLDPSRSSDAPVPKRIPAAPLERTVLQAMGSLLQRQVAFSDILPNILRVELWERSIQLVLKSDGLLDAHEPFQKAADRMRLQAASNRLLADGEHLRLIIDQTAAFRGGQATGNDPSRRSPVNDGAALLRTAHALLLEHSMSPLKPDTHVRGQAPKWRRQRRIMTLGLLAPALQKKMMSAHFSGSMDTLMCDAPLAWADQKGMTNRPT